MEKLQSKLKNIPKKSGVYQFLNKDGEIIYIGKAKNLKTRVTQYFGSHDTRPQLPYLLKEATDIRYTVVNNELESLFLENTLIKQYLPKYNILLRDDKNYAFIKIDYSTEIPQIGYARKINSYLYSPKNKTKYFGPYSAAHKIRNTLNLMRRIFPYCSANKISSRPCFYYYLHRCPGVCIGKISLKEYETQLNYIANFLSGNTSKIETELKSEMQKASLKKQFEKAARLRDQLKALELLDEKQTVIFSKPVSWDIISTHSEQNFSCMNLFKVRGGKLQDKENFIFQNDSETNADLIKQKVLNAFLEQYYLETSNIPKIIYTQIDTENTELVSKIIQERFNKSVKIITPQKNKPAALIKLGVVNAQEYLKKWLADKAGQQSKIQAALIELQNILNLPSIPKRIECYDISNIQGTNAVGSMAVFINGLPAKNEYRKFKIKNPTSTGGPDDFLMLKEVLARRLERNKKPENTKWTLPDLIVIDGGKGQLSAAYSIIQNFNLKIPVIGLAKKIEEIFLPKTDTPIILPHTNPALQLLQRLRDETHRFGITFHRNLRSKQAVKSALDDIPGIGPKTKKLLKQKFGTVAEIRKTSLHELTKIVGKKLAVIIKQAL